MIIASLSLAVVVLLFNQFSNPKSDELRTNETSENVKAFEKSIAVLPFSDLSLNEDQKAFSIGITLEIVDRLVKIEGLKVTPGTSVIQYIDTKLAPKEIAEELGVASIVGGSVRKSGDKIKINVDLIDGLTNVGIWSETYDRKLDDIFTIHSELAQKISSELNVYLSPEVIDRLNNIPTKDMKAYELYLKAKGAGAFSDSGQRIEWLKQAIELDSNFVEAYSLLGNTFLFQAGFSKEENPSDVGIMAKSYLEKALLLDPLNGIAHSEMAAYSLWFEKDFKKAEIHCRTAKRLAPSYENSFTLYLDLLLSTGRFQEAISIGTELLEIIDDTPRNRGRTALMWAFNNEKEKMNENIRQAKQAPDDILAITESARARLIQKQYDQVLEILEVLPDTMQISRVRGLKSIAFYKTGDIENHNRELNALIEKSTKTAGTSPSFYIAMIYSSKNNVDEAFRWLEKSFKDNEIEIYWLKVEPEFKSLHNDPRWQVMLDKIGFPKTN